MPLLASSSAWVKAVRRRGQPVYWVWNWAAYNAGLKQRGSLTLWLTPQVLKYDQGPPPRGSAYTYSALAIQTALMMRLLSHAPSPAHRARPFCAGRLCRQWRWPRHLLGLVPHQSGWRR